MVKPYCGVGKVPSKGKRGTMKECVLSGQVRYYGVKKIDQKLLEYAKQAKKSATTRTELLSEKIKIQGRLKALKRKHQGEKDPQEKKKINEEYKTLVTQFKKITSKLRDIERTQKRGSRKKSRSKSKSKKRRSSKRKLKRSSKRSRKRSRKQSRKQSRKKSRKRSSKKRRSYRLK